MIQRDLTPAETRALNLCKVFEKACDEHKLTVTLHASQEAAQAIQKLETNAGLVKTLKVDFDRRLEKYAIVFSMSEFRKYLDFVLPQVGLTLMIDGSLRTYDGLTITNEYLN